MYNPMHADTNYTWAHTNNSLFQCGWEEKKTTTTTVCQLEYFWLVAFAYETRFQISSPKVASMRLIRTVMIFASLAHTIKSMNINITVLYIYRTMFATFFRRLRPQKTNWHDGMEDFQWLLYKKSATLKATLNGAWDRLTNLWWEQFCCRAKKL